MIPLKGTIEVINMDLFSVRLQMLKQGFSGLGPPDLIVLTRSNDLNPNNYFKTYHHISGLSITSPSSFPAYFATLTRNIPKTLIGTPKFLITEGLCCSWNSFANVDIHLKVFNPGSCGFYYVTPNGEQYKISDLTWKELSISTALRFWRASEPIYSSLFDLSTIAAPVVHQIRPQQLSPDDIRFTVAAHPPSKELDIAIAHAVLSLGNRQIIMELLKELIPLAPKVLGQLLRYIPQKSPIFTEVLNSVENAYFYASDDIIVAYSLLCGLLNKGEINKCKSVVPLLLNSLWINPLAGIGLSKLCLALDKPEDSLYYLNASCFSRDPSWESSIITLPIVSVIRSKGSPKMIQTQIEQYLFISPLSGNSFHFYRAIAELVKDLGSIKLLNLIKNKKFNVKNNFPKFPSIELYEQNQFLSQGITSSLLIPDLFDPGIETKPIVPRLIEKLPTSQKLIDSTEFIIRELNQCENLRKSPEFTSDFEALKAVLLALRVGDFQLAEIALSFVQSKSLFAEILKMRLMCETHWTSLSNSFKCNPKKKTLNEVNSLTIAKEIAISLESFII